MADDLPNFDNVQNFFNRSSEHLRQFADSHNSAAMELAKIRNLPNVGNARDIMEELRALRVEMREQNTATRAEMREQNTAIRAEMREQNTAIRAEMREQNTAIRAALRDQTKLASARDFNVYARLQNSGVRDEAQELAALRSVSTNLVNAASLNEAIPHFPENVRALRRMNARDLRRILDAVDVEYEVGHAKRRPELSYLQKKVIKTIGIVFDLDL
ncbi:unnamed protein product [Calypogeia fissa]